MSMATKAATIIDKVMKTKKPVVTDEFVCEFCKKRLTTEKRLISHSCSLKIRWLDKDTKIAKVSFMAYQKFYQMFFKGTKPKTYDDFIRSNYYNAFTKFGRHVLGLNLARPDDFIDYVIRSNTKLDSWCSTVLVTEYIKQRQFKETWEAGLEKTILTMQEWSAKTGEHWTDFFEKVSTVEFTYDISMGKVSPWVLFNSAKAQDMLAKLNVEQLNIVQEAIDVKTWKRKILKDQLEVTQVRKFIKDCGI